MFKTNINLLKLFINDRNRCTNEERKNLGLDSKFEFDEGTADIVNLSENVLGSEKLMVQPAHNKNNRGNVFDSRVTNEHISFIVCFIKHTVYI